MSINRMQLPDDEIKRDVDDAIETLVRAGLLLDHGDSVELTPAGEEFAERTKDQDSDDTMEQIEDLLNRN